MSQRTFVLVATFCVLLLLPTVVSADGRPETELQPAQWNGQPIVADMVLAAVPPGTIVTPLLFGDYTLTPIDTTYLDLLDLDLVAYDVDSASGAIDYDLVIQFLQMTVPGSCADTNLVYGSPNSWQTGSTFGIADMNQGAAGPFVQQWAWPQIGFAQAPAWAGKNTTIAVLDVFGAGTGNLWASPRITYHAPATLPPLATNPALPDQSQHGNLIVSIARRLSPLADIMAVSTLNGNGLGYTYGVVQALDFVLTGFGDDMSHLVINMSFGAESADRCGIIEALLVAGSEHHDVVYVAAAGNGAQGGPPPPPQYPASSPAVVATGASTVGYTTAGYSQSGDLLAPGGDEPYPGAASCNDPATGIVGYVPTAPGVFTNVVSCGTSFAAAFVSGAAGYYFGYGLNATKVVDTLLEGASQNYGILFLVTPSSVQ